MVSILFKTVQGADLDLPLPQKASSGSSGFDLRANIFRDGLNNKELSIPASKWALVNTGIAIQIPAGFEGQIRSRSGLAIKHGIAVFNSPGTIDSDYRGEIGVILINMSSTPFVVKHGQRIAQLVICSVPEVNLIESKKLSNSERGSTGFGSTGLD